MSPTDLKMHLLASFSFSTASFSAARFTAPSIRRVLAAGCLWLLPCFAAAQSLVYVPNSGDDSISVVDRDLSQVVATVTGRSTPWGVTVHPEGIAAYVTHIDSDELLVIDPRTLDSAAVISVGSVPKGVVVHPNGERLFVANQEDDAVAVVDAATLEVLSTFPVGDSPRGLVLSPDGAIVYVANGEDDTVSAHDTTTGGPLGVALVGGLPKGIAIHPEGHTLYVTNFADDTLSVVDTARMEETVTVTVPSVAPAVHPDGSVVYVTTADGFLVAIRTVDLSVAGQVLVGVQPRGLAVAPDGSQVFVANAGEASVSVIETLGLTEVDRVAVGADPQSFGEFVAGPLDPTLELVVSGICPGPLTIVSDGAALLDRVALVFGALPGQATVPVGGCAGTPLDLASPRFLLRLDSDALGRGSVTIEAPAAACGGLVQTLDEATCRTSAVVSVPE